jgi:hypothetical protein
VIFRHSSFRTVSGSLPTRQDLLVYEATSCLHSYSKQPNQQTKSTMSFQASSAKVHYAPGSWQEAANDIYTGSVVGGAHSIYLVAKWWHVNCIGPILNLFGLQLNEDKIVESKDGEKTLKVVAVGYGRTGTVRCERETLRSVGMGDPIVAGLPKFSFGRAGGWMSLSTV